MVDADAVVVCEDEKDDDDVCAWGRQSHFDYHQKVEAGLVEAGREVGVVGEEEKQTEQEEEGEQGEGREGAEEGAEAEHVCVDSMMIAAGIRHHSTMGY